MLLLIMGMAGQGMTAHATTPRVMLTGYSLDKDDVYPGDTFTVKFKLQNTSKNKIMNLKCQAVTGGEFLPADGVGTFYVEEMKGKEEQEYSFSFEAVKGLSEKTYSIKIKTEYEDWNGSYTSEDTVYIPIKLKTEVLVSDTYIAEEDIRLGDNVEIISTINNIGAADIYKVTAEVTGHNIADATSYIGNIKSGKSGNIDIITKAIAADDPGDATMYDNDVIITYEDISGNKFTEKASLGNINVLEQDYSDIIQIKEDTSRKMTEKDKLLIAATVIVAILVILTVRHVAKRKRLEREFD
ncbi:MAG: hypothetical protein J5517_01015 [Eubacterium sp.]|nr:hypothetical protein [Eubacterium sp.]